MSRSTLPHLRRAALPLGALLVAAGCGQDPTTAALQAEEPFVAVPHSAAHDPGVRREGLTAAAAPADVAQSDQDFYLAIHKRELGGRWFLSSFLTQYFPGAVANGAARSLGTRVVTFRVQNGRLFVFDASGNDKVSDTFSPDLVIDAYPVVDYAPFRGLAGADRYVVFDPAAGLNHYGLVGDAFAGNTYQPSRFSVELSYLQRFRRVADGVTFEDVFVGYGTVPDGYSYTGNEPNQFRGSGTLGLAIRRYSEGVGYSPVQLPQRPYYFASDPRIIANQGRRTQSAVHWNIHPGMKPIRWVLSDQFADVAKDPRFAGVDVIAAVKAGVERWNDVFGFRALEAVVGTPADSFGDDDTNYVIFDKDPTNSYAFANWRTNPSTGEIRGASVYYNAVWLDVADKMFHDDKGWVALPAGDKDARPALRLDWAGQPTQFLCAMRPPRLVRRGDAGTGETTPGGDLGDTAQLTRKQKVEQYITHILLHEIGHTLGLRHNFKGSLAPGSWGASASVMDYMDESLRVSLDHPGPYDAEAIGWLYGLPGAHSPTYPFCTDEDTAYDTDCTRFDSSADPIHQVYEPAYRRVLGDYLEGRSGSAPSSTLNDVLKYVRSGSGTQRLDAWATAIEPLRVPVPAAKLAAYPGTYATAVDLATRRLFQRLYLDPAQLRTNPQTNNLAYDPPSDPAWMPLLLGELRANLLDLDQVRQFPTRRICVDVLKKLQSLDALAVLTDGRAALVAARGALTGATLAQTDDLIARIDAATHPYFTN